MLRKSSPSLVLSWIDPRLRLGWCGLCLLLLLALAEITWRGHATLSLAGLLAGCVAVWLGRLPSPTQQRLELWDEGLRWFASPQATGIDLTPLPGSLLLPRLVVLRWRDPRQRSSRYLWIWRSDVGSAGFRHLRRWLLCEGMIDDRQRLRSPR